MKFSTSLIATMAPLALAKSVHNHFPMLKRGREAAVRAGMSGAGLTKNALTEVVVIWVNPGNGAATTTINQQVTVTQTVTAGAGGQQTVVPPAQGAPTVGNGATGTVAAGGATHSVTVGGPGGLAFAPDNVKAAVGDMVVFTFMSKNHSATQSAFDKPCDPLAGGMDSGFQPNPDNSIAPPPQVAMQVMVDTPLWFFCAQMGHCGKGMTFSINPSTEKTQAMFQAMAIQQKGTGTPSAITGGDAAAPPPPPPENANNPASSVAADPALSSLQPLPGAETGTGAAVPTATGTGNIVQGTGTVLPDGACACAVVVGAGAFPAVGAQGAGNFGGMPGALPASMAEAV